MDPDRHLVRMAKLGNKAALGKLARRYRDAILRLAYDILNDYEKAREVAQRVFIEAFKNIRDFEEKISFSSWLMRLTLNASMAVRKDNVPRRKYLITRKTKKNVKPEIESGIDETRLDNLLIERIGELSKRQQTAIVLRYFNNHSVREIADVLDCTESTVRSHLHAALQKLDRNLRKRK